MKWESPLCWIYLILFSPSSPFSFPSFLLLSIALPPFLPYFSIFFFAYIFTYNLELGRFKYIEKWRNCSNKLPPPFTLPTSMFHSLANLFLCVCCCCCLSCAPIQPSQPPLDCFEWYQITIVHTSVGMSKIRFLCFF